ncbi:hypothetical protein A2U01_0115996, partial [Trifolium medium]|nr:hypothetical protein [Trifolium medium]
MEGQTARNARTSWLGSRNHAAR